MRQAKGEGWRMPIEGIDENDSCRISYRTCVLLRHASTAHSFDSWADQEEAWTYNSSMTERIPPCRHTIYYRLDNVLCNWIDILFALNNHRAFINVTCVQAQCHVIQQMPIFL